MEIKYLQTRPHALMLKHSLKDLVLDFADTAERDTWIAQVAHKMKTTGADWITPQPHTSFAPAREDIYAKFFINGASYMPAVADALESAKEEIFIGGWWVAPEVFLKRPVTEGTKWRLDKILKRKAEEGVKIYILMYKESRVALGINSLYSKKKLATIHPNIMVQRHPDHNVLLWSHHEKCVIIDQKLAFLGGIDLCYGRWEDYHYRMNDQSPEMRQSKATGSLKKASESLAGRKFDKAKHKAGGPRRRGKKRHAWGQAAMAPVRGVQARMNVPRFRFGSKMNHRYRTYRRSFLSKTALALSRSGCKNKSDSKVEEGTPDEELNELGRTYTWIGKDYINEVREAFSQSDNGHPYEDELDRDKVPRLPWHDAGTCMWGVAARDLARHFIQKWNACKFQKVRFESEYPFIIPKRYGDLEAVTEPPCENTHRCRVQVLRSTASWCVTLKNSENTRF
ncbi:hypothetical protein RvY_07640-2 [Ramazzottius varieornatus]|uniref:phospholipase D n=1 Tax=Ramazzottius varieornatus TaxID=947166 RepID=A0A1D1V2X4_RAMVA|nr:hypothetical protein RvY_07640-2 [Ramazzottius varieornatus]